MANFNLTSAQSYDLISEEFGPEVATAMCNYFDSAALTEFCEFLHDEGVIHKPELFEEEEDEDDEEEEEEEDEDDEEEEEEEEDED